MVAATPVEAASQDGTKSFRVGQRICVSSARGTIRYVGRLQGHEGVWLGVEWDEQGRGKNDGSLQGVRYFELRHGCVLGDILAGVPFTTALKARYVDDSAFDETRQWVDGKLSRRNLSELEISAPNLARVAAKVSNLSRLRVVALMGDTVVSSPEGSGVAAAFDIDGGEEQGCIKETCPKLSRITSELSQLQILKVSLNRFEDPRSEPPLPGSLAQIKELHTNSSLSPWRDVEALSSELPRLETLHHASNGISLLSGTGCHFSSLHTLNLERNDLHDWMDVARSLCRLPNLQRLILSHNRIAHIPACEGGEKAQPFPSLRHLDLQGNPIGGWEDVEHLDTWAPGKGMRSLQISDGSGRPPIDPELDERDFRYLCISRLAALESLDGTPIRPIERAEAAQFWTSYVERRGLSRTGPSPVVDAPGPQTGNLHSRLIQLRVHLCEQEPQSEHPQLRGLIRSATVKVLPSTVLRVARGKLLRALSAAGVDALGGRTTTMWAVYAAATAAAGASERGTTHRMVAELDEARELGFYGVTSEDELVVVVTPRGGRE